MTMTYEDILDLIFVETGQYISDLDSTLLDKPKVVRMIKKELATYSRYKPKTVIKPLSLYNGKTFDETIDGEVPRFISSINTERMQANPAATSLFNNIPRPISNYYWRYHKPVLYFTFPSGLYETTYLVDYKYDDDDDLIEGMEPDVYDNFFTELLIGRFLMSVGRSRKAFTVDELPINTDADAMVSTGESMYEKALNELRINSKFWHAVLV